MNDDKVQGTNGFPWKRGFLSALGAMAGVFVLFNLGGLITELGFVAAVHTIGGDFAAAINAHKMFVMATISDVGYIVGSLMVVWFLKKLCGTTSVMAAVRGRWSDFQPRINQTIMWAVIGFFAIHIFDIFYMLLPLPVPKVPSSEAASHMSGAALVMFALGASFLGPIFEEIICRGFIFNILRSTFSKSWAPGIATVSAMVVSAAFFSALHMTLSAFVPLFFFGLVAAEIYRRTGNIYASMLMHFMNNALVSLIFLLH